MNGMGHNSGAGGGDGGLPVVAVSLPTALIRLFPGSPNEVRVAAGSVREVVDALEDKWPGMRDRLTDTRPAIRRHLNIFVDGEKASLETTVRAGQRVTILTAVSGG